MPEQDDAEISNKVRKFALLNAVEHSGIADVGSVVSRILAEIVSLRKEAQLVKRVTSFQVAQVNMLDRDTQENELRREFPGELEKYLAIKKQVSKRDSERTANLPDLLDAVYGAVVTRFPPEPNGFMHIGHAKAAMIGYEYAKRYSGKFIVRFDDTNPSAEQRKYYDAFLESLNWLGIEADKVKNASDDILLFYELAEKLIGNSGAYVCSCSQEEMKRDRGLGVECAHRHQTKDQNLSLWKEMLSGLKKLGTTTLRLVGDMQSLNTTMRDPVLFRIVTDPHPLKGNQFCVWPTYDFDGAVEDSLDGVTHALRSKEYELRDETYYKVLDALGLRKPRIIEFSRLELQNTTVSKRNLRKLLNEGLVGGWDDPRLPTIAGLKRRGFLPAAIRAFILSMGISKVESQPTWDLFESINRKLLDPVSKRFFFVEDPVEMEVLEAPRLEVSLRFHPEKELGRRTIVTEGKFMIPGGDAGSLSPGTLIRLMEAYNVEVVSAGSKIIARYVEGDSIDRLKKLQWVVPNESLPLSISVLGPLLLGEKFNPESLRLAKGLIEASGSDIAVGESFQLVRFGFCRLDSPREAILTHK
ncbi:MAG: glutamate--tRNA ligase [Nitrososphaerota archaeon]|nr:glutamate--tRNA ligase [Nitrososphaerota archaeon]MDG6921681.1 glutamate--tRNA ligase [Nitrososphaerota archaeon]